jgi:hypothetical protein
MRYSNTHGQLEEYMMLGNFDPEGIAGADQLGTVGRYTCLILQLGPCGTSVAGRNPSSNRSDAGAEGGVLMHVIETLG